jgi:Arc/MetJ-type ribon-helix-helix transcriptional regulator
MRPTDHSHGDGTRTISIPEETAKEISNRLQDTEFESIDSYVAFALEQLLRELEQLEAEGSGDDRDVSRVPREDSSSSEGSTDDAVAERLESLGYR